MKHSGLLKIVGLILLTILAASPAFSQAYAGTARIKGIVTDKLGNPLSDVQVKLYHVESDSGFETRTNKDGQWQANMIKGGTWYIDFSKTGYETKKISLQVTEGMKKPPVVETKLAKLEGLVVTDDVLSELDKANKLFNEGKIDEAINAYNAILEKNAEAYVINYSLGNCYFIKEDYNRAIEFYKKVYEKNPSFTNAIIGIGNAYINQNKVDEAMEWYNKLDISKIDDAVVLYNIGSNYFNRSRHDLALKYYKRAVELEPNFVDALYQLGLTYLTLGNYQDSFNAFSEYLKYDSESARAEQVKNFLEFLKNKI
ncbi:MAG TPA: tetratricopeptide repeat protein [Candidatus Saccharicenans sp.]|nr:tetratricopeptide repeat protein [Candidatus Saccharicenans sp.]